MDGDAAAAMRYTEIRMAKIAHEMLADIEEETVNFGDNYDGSEREPLVLPTRFPALLVNGSEGIAVGMATSIPPHNLRDTLAGCLKLLNDPDTGIDELIDIVKAPDFPTGATIYGLTGIRAGYQTGRGRVVIRSKSHIEPIGKNGEREAIVVDEIPYQVNKSKLVEKIGELVREKTVEGIAELRDESDKDGTRIVIELKRGENAEVVLNQLYKLTQLQDTFSINMVALVDENTATELLLGYDFENEGAVEAIMQVLSLLSAKYPVTVEVDDSMEALVQVTDVLLRAGTASVEGDPTYIYVTE